MRRRVIGFEDLKPKGIKYTRQHIDRLVKKKRFPPPFKMSGSDKGPNSWFEDVIDEHIEDCAAKTKAAANA